MIFGMFLHTHSWFDAHHASGVVLQVDGQSRLHSAPSWNHGFGLQHPLHHTQCIMQRALHLVTHEVIRSTQDYRGWCASLRTKNTHTHTVRVVLKNITNIEVMHVCSIRSCVKTSGSYFLMRMSSSSHTLSWTTSSAWPNMAASNDSSPSRLDRDEQMVAAQENK